MAERPASQVAVFDDRVVSLLGQPEAFADLAGILGSPTRVQILAALARAEEPLHIHALARRVGVDASPVRVHLEVLARAGLAREVRLGVGRERKFTTDVSDARVSILDVHRPRPGGAGPLPKAAARLLKKLAALGKKREKIDAEAGKLRAELARVLRAGPG